MTQSAHVILPTHHTPTWSAMLTVSPCTIQYFPQSPTVSQCSHKKSQTEGVTALLYLTDVSQKNTHYTGKNEQNFIISINVMWEGTIFNLIT